MFSANENILLRQHKRRVIEYVESTIPETALDLGTSVMVMQVSCRQPGCVPLETAITVVFPRPPRKMKKKKRSGAVAQEEENKDDDDAADEEEIPSFPKPLLPNLEESRIGGNYKTRILKPLSDVTQDDVLDALPPSFTGGRRTVESICIKARDMIFAQIGQLVGNGDDDTTTNDSAKDSSSSVEGRKLVAEYLKVCLEEYVERGCVPPEWGEKEGWGSSNSGNKTTTTEEKKDSDGENADHSVDADKNTKKWGEGNIVFKRPTEDDDDNNEKDAESSKSSSRIAPATTRSTNNATTPTTTSTAAGTTTSSQQLLDQITQSEHAPGIRRAGCPCCDPDGATTYVDKMMMGGFI